MSSRSVDGMDVVLLHENPEYLAQCAEVLNEEWPRSNTARIHYLQKSSNSLPISLVLLETNLNSKEVLGHCRLCKVQKNPKACFIEAVVIRKCKRGQGLGRKIMEKMEEFALEYGLTEIFLSTHDQEGFYGRLGYQFCEPVVCLGSNSKLVSDEMFDKLFGNMNRMNLNKPDTPTGGVHKPNVKSSSIAQRSTSTDTNVLPPHSVASPPPPPPPPPPLLPTMNKSSNDKLGASKQTTMYWMKKELRLQT